MDIKDCRVLVFKKDKQVRDVTLKMLSQIGFEENNIFLAGDIKEVEEIIIDRQKIRLILAGIGEGYKFLNWYGKCNIKFNIERRMIFVFYSGGGEHHIRQLAEAYGADGYISLPVDTVTLESKLREILSKK